MWPGAITGLYTTERGTSSGLKPAILHPLIGLVGHASRHAFQWTANLTERIRAVVSNENWNAPPPRQTQRNLKASAFNRLVAPNLQNERQLP